MDIFAKQQWHCIHIHILHVLGLVAQCPTSAPRSLGTWVCWSSEVLDAVSQHGL